MSVIVTWQLQVVSLHCFCRIRQKVLLYRLLELNLDLCSQQASWFSHSFGVIAWAQNIPFQQVSENGPTSICFTIRITEHKVVQKDSFKMPLKWHLCSKNQRCEISNHLASQLGCSSALGSEAERRSGFSRALCSLPLLLLCTLGSQSFYLCCHFPGSS